MRILLALLLTTAVFGFERYKPLYFISGEEDIKAQLSGKYQILNNKVPNVYIGYTQKLLWDAFAKSEPVYDIIYNPEVFWRIQMTELFDYMDLGLFEHHSNGNKEAGDRSYDSSYVRFHSTFKTEYFTYKKMIGYHLLYNVAYRNEDISDYVPNFEVGVTTEFNKTYTYLDKISFSTTIIAGSRFNFRRGSKEFGISFRPFPQVFKPSVYVQYFTGYGESLLGYNQYIARYRFGVLL